MALEGRAKRVRIYVNEGDLLAHEPVHTAILRFLRKENASGATVFRAIEGFGSSGEMHTALFADLASKLPLVIEWIDSVERVNALMPKLTQMVPHGLITVDPTEVYFFDPHPIRDIASSQTTADVMSRDVRAVSRDAPVREVVELMLGRSVRAVPVVTAGVPVGIVTNTDLVRRGGLAIRTDLLPSLGPKELASELARLAESPLTAAEIMSPNPVLVSHGTPLAQVAEIMSHRHLKQILVVDEAGTLAGVVSRADLLRTVAATFETVRPGNGRGAAGEARLIGLVRRDVPTVSADTPLSEVLKAVISTPLNRAVVIDAERRILGMVSDAELLDRVTPAVRHNAFRALIFRLPFVHPSPEEVATEQHARARTASGLMSREVPVVKEDSLLKDAVAATLRGTEELVVVVDQNERLVGVVDRDDLLRGLRLGA